MSKPITYMKPATAIRAGDTISDQNGRYTIRRVVQRDGRIYLDFGGRKVIELMPGDVVTCVA